MALTEAMRHRLFQHFEQLMGPDEAEAMMELLPPVGWADVATKRDLDALGDQLRAELYRGQKQLLLAVLGANAGMAATFAAIAFAAARLA
ncbi:MAG: hypothetical protein JWN67_3004 [Actinomycetia bacterium]|nr:hypothetical protein [Actinomycetes bacterium]